MMLIRIILWLFWNERHKKQRLEQVLRKLQLQKYITASGKTELPFELHEATHTISIQLHGDEVRVAGCSPLVFGNGQVPDPVVIAVDKRNQHLNGFQWALWNNSDHEYFAVTASVSISAVTSRILGRRIVAIVEEIERCRLILQFVKERHGSFPFQSRTR